MATEAERKAATRAVRMSGNLSVESAERLADAALEAAERVRKDPYGAEEQDEARNGELDARIKELEEALDDQRKGWDESMAAVEAETLAKVRERVEAERKFPLSRNELHNAAIDDCLRAIQEADDE